MANADGRPEWLRPGSIALVFAGGALGGGAREALTAAVPAGAPVPIGVLAANLLGALLLGVLLEGLAGRRSAGAARVRLLLGTGVLGGFTTYSALALAVAALARDGQGWTAVGYGLGTVLLGALATLLGIVAGAALRRGRGARRRGTSMAEPLLHLLAALAAGLGAVARLLLDGAITSAVLRADETRAARRSGLPWGTLAVNLSGSLLIGAVAGSLAVGGFAAGAPVVGSWPLAAALGLLGGYTTFSTASIQTVRLLREGRWAAGLANGLGQLLLAVAAVALGWWIAASLVAIG